MRNKGFTLVEILVVVVIAVSVVAFSIPAYKKTQEKSNYNAARGLLMQLGGAVEALRSDMKLEGVPYSFPVFTVTPAVEVVANWNTGGSTNQYNKVHDAATLGILGKSNFSLGCALVIRNYMPEVPLDSNNKFKGYTFYICSTQGTPNYCCNNDAEVVVCMTNGTMKAVYRKGGIVERLSS